jgi:hypothetical protein
LCKIKTPTTELFKIIYLKFILEQKDKKKKFRPLERMRKFFKSTKKSSKTKDSDKAKSTGALHKDSGLSEDDDEGG